jgi:hypothetical protein
MIIMVSAIFMIQWLMKRWTLCHGQYLLTKLKKVLEQDHAEVSGGVEPACESDAVPDRGVAIELENFGTGVSSSGGNVSPV